MDNFTLLKLPPSLQKSLDKLKFGTPTEVQKQAIPQALTGKDIIISAPTGTGKTLAFCIPIITKALEDKNNNAIIITPTRELASQIITVLRSLLSYNHHIKSTLLIGGTPMNKQLAGLKATPQIIVGTPGRINDHLKRKTLNLKNTKFVVLDEMDRMLDMGFSIQIDQIFEFLPTTRQVLMLSATIPPPILKLSKKYLNNPGNVTIDASEIVNTDIKQEFIHTSKEQKYHDLLDQLSKRQGTIIIFVKTRKDTEDLAKRLSKDSFRAKAIHGALRQHQRDKIIRLFRKEEYHIVVATDVAARGIDVPHIRHVINYNLPTNPEDYVHRVGRTGRAGLEGYALCFISPNEKKEWHALEHFLDPSKPKPRSTPQRKHKPRRRFGRPGGNKQKHSRSPSPKPRNFNSRKRNKK